MSNLRLLEDLNIKEIVFELKERVPQIDILFYILTMQGALYPLHNRTECPVLSTSKNSLEILLDQLRNTIGPTSAILQNGLSLQTCPIVFGEQIIGFILSHDVSDSCNLASTGSSYEHPINTSSNEGFNYKWDIIKFVHALTLNIIHIQRQNKFVYEALQERDSDTLINHIVIETPKLIWGYHCSIFIWSMPLGKFMLAGTSSEKMESFVNREGYAPGEGFTGWVGKYGIPLKLGASTTPHGLASLAKAHNIPVPQWSGTASGVPKMMERSGNNTWQGLVVPIREQENDTPIGIIRLCSERFEEDPTDAQLTLLTRIARLMCGPIMLTRLSARNRQLVDHVFAMSNAVSDSNVDESIRVLLNDISTVFDSFSSHIRIRDRSRDRWIMFALSNSPFYEAIHGRGPKDLTSGRIIASLLEDNDKRFECDNDVQSGPSVKSDIQKFRDVGDNAYAEYLEAIGSTLVFPLKGRHGNSIKHDIVGMLNLHRRVGQRGFDENEIRQIERLAPALGTLVDAIELAAWREGERGALSGIDIDGTDLLNSEQLWDNILQNALSMFDCELALVRQQEGQRLKLIHYKKVDSFKENPPQYRNLGEGGSGLAAQRNETCFIPNADLDPIYQNKEYAFENWIKSEIAVPMTVAGSLRILTIVSSVPDKFKLRDLYRLQGFVDRARLVGHASYLIEEQAAAARWRQLARVTSHEIVSKADALSNYVDILRHHTHRSDNEKLRDYLQGSFLPNARLQINEVRSISNQLRDPNLVSLMNCDLKDQVDINELLEDIVRRNHCLCAVQLEAVQELSLFTCDRRKIMTAFSLLIQNAEQAGAKNVLLSARVLGAQHRLKITVEDDGENIPREKRNRLFEFGYTTKTEGSGLGLFHVKMIVEAHKGSIKYEELASVNDAGFMKQFALDLPLT